MSDIRRNADRNRAIQAMMTDGEQLKTFYRFVANNPHIALHDACQIVIERPNASVCFSFEEWNAQGRRVTKGRKGIPYYDSDGNKYFVFDVADTHGENRYRRVTQPVKKILDGLDLLNGTEIADSNRGDYRIMLSGVVTYLGQNDFLTENDEIRNRLIAEGVAYSLYSTTGFPKERGITLKGYPYGLQDNADLFREVQKAVEVLQQDINDAIYNKQNEVPVIDDIDEEYVSDEPVIPKADEQPVAQEEKTTVLPYYAEYLRVQKANPDSIVVYRLGDFYEVMGEKAEQAATILDLTLTGRDVGLDERIPMCGFPYHVADRYFGKLTESVSVVVVEPDAAPFKILSRAEARKTPELAELSPEESEEIDRIFSEQEEADEQPDYVGEIDTRFPIDDNYHKRFPLDILLEYYGWDYGDVYKALAENIPDAELREYATNTEKEVSFDEFMQKQLADIDWSDMVDGENDGSFDDIISDLKPEFENSAFNESNDEYPYDYWYDDFAEEKIMPYLREQVKKSGYKSINEPVLVESPNYKELVRESVEKEFEEFKVNLMSKSAEEIFQSNYEIHIKTELFDTLCGEYVDVGEEYYRALYEEVDHGGILQQLYDDFISSENASVNTGEDTILFIKDYCEHYHSDVMKEYLGEENFAYFGTDEENTAYYYFKDSLSVDNLNRIKEQADEYIIAAPVLYMSQESLEDKNITFLKVDRDVDEAELKINDEIAKFAMRAAYNKKLPLEATMISRNCGSDIEKGISTHFDGMHLNTDFIANLYALYGEERMNYVLANTVQMSDGDGRYSPGNKAWAKEININNAEDDRRTFYVNSHPAVLDGFITAYRKHVKEFKEQLDKEENKEQMSENTRDYTKITARGDKVVNIEKDIGGRDIAIIDRTATSNKDYVVAIGYHTATGDWEQGRYGFESQEKAENWRKNEYGSEKPKIEYTKINVANDAFIKKSGVGSVFKMPTNGEYAGFTYYMFNDKIRPSRQLVDLQSDSRELCYELSVRDDREIELRKGYGDNEQIVVLTAEEFKEAVGGTTNKDYETQENTDTKWLNTSVPQEAFRKEYPKSMLFVLPNKQDFGGMSFFIPSAFVGEDKNSDDGRILIRLPEDFVIKAQSRDETREATLTAYDFNRLCNNTTAEDYKQTQAVSAPGSETPSDWNYVSVPEKARIASFDESTLFRMPDGKYQDYTYYVPNKCVKENAEKGTIRLSLHNDYTVRLSDNSGEEKKTAELSAKDFCEEVRGKDAVAYGADYKRPSVEANTSFDEKEKTLRTAVPDEMKARPNWVVVKTWWNADKGKYNKRPVNCNSDKGEYAESDNPETWTTFDNALKYLKEKGGTTVAYALDGKDNISCIDLDRCYDENGQPSALAKEVLSKCGKTYIEKSVSGNGLHIFGKTSGMDIRTFSKDGDLEFYQKEHFIAMTGDGSGYSRLESFDTPEMKELLSRKCEKREEWKGVCKGVNGLSTMTDRDVVEKASNAKNGDKFKRLYAGEDLQNNHSNSDMSLMNLLAYWCNGDKEQMLRIFATSGLFRPNKSPDYYEGTAIKALRSMPVKSTYTPTVPRNTGGNGKR